MDRGNLTPLECLMQTSETPVTYFPFHFVLGEDVCLPVTEGVVAPSKLISLEVARISLVCQAMLPGVSVLTRNKRS